MTNKKIYFASDIHLGLCAEKRSYRIDRVFAGWLNEIAADAEAIYIVGDLFDFWFEYKKVVPKGFARVLGKLAELADAGVEIHIFPGNHDMWMFGYLEEELGAIVHHKQPYEVTLCGKRFFIAHGDGLGVGDRSYKLLRRFFTSRFLQRLFAMLHPRIGIGLAHVWSKHSRLSKGVAIPFNGASESLYCFSQDMLKKQHVDYFVFGHRHTPLIIGMEQNASLVILGEWIEGCEYAVFDGEKLELKKYETLDINR